MTAIQTRRRPCFRSCNAELWSYFIIGARRLAAVSNLATRLMVFGDKVQFPHKDRCHGLDVAGIPDL